jgi:hypothetical protein
MMRVRPTPTDLSWLFGFEEDIISELQHRLDGLPVHSVVYCQSYNQGVLQNLISFDIGSNKEAAKEMDKVITRVKSNNWAVVRGEGLDSATIATLDHDRSSYERDIELYGLNSALAGSPIRFNIGKSHSPIFWTDGYKTNPS